MCKVQMLRALVKQRLTAAAEEIFGLFERTIAEYEEELSRSKEENERQRKLLDAVFSPQLRLHRADVQQLLVVKDEVPPEQQECSSSVDQEEPEPPHIKEEQEELWSSQEGEQLRGLEEADITAVPVKSEDDEEKAQSSQLHHRLTEQMETGADGEDCGGPEPARNSHPHTHLQPDTDDETPHSEPETDDSCDWEETKEPQSGLNLLQNNEEPVRDAECNTEKTSVSSSECATSFDHKGHLQKHTGEKLFSCSVCGKTFTKRSGLITHLKVHTERKGFSCSVCYANFNFRSTLAQHMIMHTDKKEFSCSVCGKEFSRKFYLMTHMRLHSGEKPFTCSVCKTSFTTNGTLAKHMRTHTGEKPFSCEVCGKRFAQQSTLKQHLPIHTGEKPFSCSVCGKRFAVYRTLKQHFPVHTGEKPFSCSVCDKKFARHHHLKIHKCVGESSRNK